MVNVVAPESGTVEAPPETVFSLKLPSGLVIAHSSTPFVFQKIDVRAPSGTREGTAQISTSGSTVAAGGGVGVVCLFDTVVVVCFFVTAGAIVGVAEPT